MRSAVEPKDQRAQNKIERVEQSVHNDALFIDCDQAETIRNNRQQHHPNHRMFAYPTQKKEVIGFFNPDLKPL